MFNYRNHGDGMSVDHCSYYITKPVSQILERFWLVLKYRHPTTKLSNSS